MRTLGAIFDFIPFHSVAIAGSSGEILAIKTVVVERETNAHFLVLVLLLRLFRRQSTAVRNVVRDWMSEYFQMRANLVRSSGFWNATHQTFVRFWKVFDQCKRRLGGFI